MFFVTQTDIKCNIIWMEDGISSFILFHFLFFYFVISRLPFVILCYVCTFLLSCSLSSCLTCTHSFIVSSVLAVTVWNISPSDPTHLSAFPPPFLLPSSICYHFYSFRHCLPLLRTSVCVSLAHFLCLYHLTALFLLQFFQCNNKREGQRDPQATVGGFFLCLSAFPLPVAL